MVSLIWIAALTVLTAGCSNSAGEPQNDNWLTSANDALAELKWKRRLLVVAAPDADSTAWKRQHANMTDSASGQLKAGYAERDLTPILIIGNADTVQVGNQTVNVQDFRRRLNLLADSFTVVLIGKDGGEKRRDSKPIESADLFATIDAMPMRQHEMR